MLFISTIWNGCLAQLKYCLSALFVDSQQSAFCNYDTSEKEEEKEKFELQDYVALKFNKRETETPLYPNVLLAQIVELEGDCAKIIIKFGFITTKRLSKIKKTQISYLIIQKK